MKAKVTMKYMKPNIENDWTTLEEYEIEDSSYERGWILRFYAAYKPINDKLANEFTLGKLNEIMLTYGDINDDEYKMYRITIEPEKEEKKIIHHRESTDKRYLVTLATWKSWIDEEYSKCGDANVACDLARELESRGALLNTKAEDGRIIIPAVMAEIDHLLGDAYADRAVKYFEKLYPGFTIRIQRDGCWCTNYPFINAGVLASKVINPYDTDYERIYLQVGFDTRGGVGNFEARSYKAMLENIKNEYNYKLQLVNVYRDISRWFSEVIGSSGSNSLLILDTLNLFDRMYVHDDFQANYINTKFREKFAKCIGEIAFYRKGIKELDIKEDSNNIIYFGRPKRQLISLIRDHKSLYNMILKDGNKLTLMCNFGNNKEDLKHLLKSYECSYIKLDELKSLEDVDNFFKRDSVIYIVDGYYNFDRAIHRRVVQASRSKYYLKIEPTYKGLLDNYNAEDLRRFDIYHNSGLEYADMEAVQLGLKIIARPLLRYKLETKDYEDISRAYIKNWYDVKRYVNKLMRKDIIMNKTLTLKNFHEINKKYNEIFNKFNAGGSQVKTAFDYDLLDELMKIPNEIMVNKAQFSENNWNDNSLSLIRTLAWHIEENGLVSDHLGEEPGITYFDEKSNQEFAYSLIIDEDETRALYITNLTDGSSYVFEWYKDRGRTDKANHVEVYEIRPINYTELYNLSVPILRYLKENSDYVEELDYLKELAKLDK